MAMDRRKELLINFKMSVEETGKQRNVLPSGHILHILIVREECRILNN